MLQHPCWIFNYFMEGFSSSPLLLLCCADEILKLRSVVQSGPIQGEAHVCVHVCVRSPDIWCKCTVWTCVCSSQTFCFFLHKMWFGLFSRYFSSEVTDWKQIALVINFFFFFFPLRAQFNLETQTFNV